MTRKRKVIYPPSRSSKGAPPPRAPQVTPPTVATINTQAGVGRAGIVPGLRVVIQGTGLYTGETAVVQSLVPGVIAAAVVKTDGGQTRRVRTVDLAPAPKVVAEPAGAAPAGAAPAGATPAGGVATPRSRYGPDMDLQRESVEPGCVMARTTRARHHPPGRGRSYPGDGGRPVWPVLVAPDPDVSR